MKTVNLILSKALKENRYPQLKSDFHWVVTMTQPYHLSYTLSDPKLLPDHNDFIASPTCDEILDQLPQYLRKDGLNGILKIEKAGDYGWTVLYAGVKVIYKEANSLADAAAKCWLFLKKENLL